MVERGRGPAVSRRRVLTLGGAALVGAAGYGSLFRSRAAPATATTESSGPPTVYSTDLSHPHVDPDDHLDIAVAHGLGIDVRVVILDQPGSSGHVPVAQLNAITARSWRAHDRDTAARIRAALRAAGRSAAIVVVGSCRNVAAAYSSDPALFHEKVERIAIFAGDASAEGFVEYNVALDPAAFLRLMGSGLPIRWIPCFDGGAWQAGMRSSYVQTQQADLFPDDLPAAVLRYFAYMIRKETSDPIAYLSAPVTAEDLALLHDGVRNLWVGPLVGVADGDGSLRWRGGTVAAFEPVAVRFALSGAVDPGGPIAAQVERWRVLDAAGWRRAMVAGTVDALRRIVLVSG